jgi:hypothetical protein
VQAGQVPHPAASQQEPPSVHWFGFLFYAVFWVPLLCSGLGPKQRAAPAWQETTLQRQSFCLSPCSSPSLPSPKLPEVSPPSYPGPYSPSHPSLNRSLPSRPRQPLHLRPSRPSPNRSMLPSCRHLRPRQPLHSPSRPSPKRIQASRRLLHLLHSRRLRPRQPLHLLSSRSQPCWPSTGGCRAKVCARHPPDRVGWPPMARPRCVGLVAVGGCSGWG